MKRLLIALALAGTLVAWADRPPTDVKPQAHYGSVARRLVNMLEQHHVLQHRFDDEISRRAWTNLVTQYDPAHMIFLKSDLDRFAYMETQIDDALRAKDVSFGYEIYRVFCERLADRVNFVTNLLQTTEFDFSKEEEYRWSRKDAPWPQTREENDELWRKRIKNELLSQTLSRELDEEKAKQDEAKEKKGDKGPKDGATGKKLENADSRSSDVESPNETDKDKADKDKTDKADKTDKDKTDKDKADKDKDEPPPEPVLTPKENMIKRYRHYLAVATEPDEETVLQRYLSAAASAYDPHSDYMSPTRKEDFDMDMNLTLCGVGAVLSFDPDDGTLKIQDL